MAKTRSKRGSVVGIQYAQAWLVDSGGYMMGSAGESAANGSTLHALLLRNPKSAQLPAPARVKVPLRGGNRWLGQVMFGVDDIGDFTLSLADLDADFHAMAGQSTVDGTTNTRWYRVSDNLNLVNLPQLGLLMSSIYQDREDGGDSENLWINYIVPRAQVSPSFPATSYQAESEVVYTVSPAYSSREPTGKTFASGTMALKENKALVYAIITPKPLALTTFVGDAAETDFVLGYKPTSSIVTLNSAANEFARQGTLQALTSVSTTTAVAVMAAAGLAGDRNTCMYETDFENVA